VGSDADFGLWDMRTGRTLDAPPSKGLGLQTVHATPLAVVVGGAVVVRRRDAASSSTTMVLGKGKEKETKRRSVFQPVAANASHLFAVVRLREQVWFLRQLVNDQY
jgi:hypothetical protein